MKAYIYRSQRRDDDDDDDDDGARGKVRHDGATSLAAGGAGAGRGRAKTTSGVRIAGLGALRRRACASVGRAGREYIAGGVRAKGGTGEVLLFYYVMRGERSDVAVCYNRRVFSIRLPSSSSSSSSTRIFTSPRKNQIACSRKSYRLRCLRTQPSSRRTNT
jgi:hypothetical protein